MMMMSGCIIILQKLGQFANNSQFEPSADSKTKSVLLLEALDSVNLIHVRINRWLCAWSSFSSFALEVAQSRKWPSFAFAKPRLTGSDLRNKLPDVVNRQVVALVQSDKSFFF